MLKSMYVLLSLLFSALPAQQPVAAAPAEVVPATNPVKATAASQAFARKMYGYDCAMCHGVNGDGKGEVAAGMKPAPGDWTNPATLKDLTDGEIYTVIKNGKGEMQGEGPRLKSDEVWNMVLLVRSYAKK